MSEKYLNVWKMSEKCLNTVKCLKNVWKMSECFFRHFSAIKKCLTRVCFFSKKSIFFQTFFSEKKCLNGENPMSESIQTFFRHFSDIFQTFLDILQNVWIEFAKSEKCLKNVWTKFRHFSDIFQTFYDIQTFFRHFSDIIQTFYEKCLNNSDIIQTFWDYILH